MSGARLRDLEIANMPACRMHNRKTVLFTSLVSISLAILLLALAAGGKMTSPKITKLSEVEAGILRRDGHDELVHDPVPIVLWSSSDPSATLYYSQENVSSTETFIQKIFKLPPKRGGLGDRFGSLFDDFPIVRESKGMTEADLNRFDGVEPTSITTADVNGDGVDELIFATRLGSAFVYSPAKMLFKYKPTGLTPDLHDFEILPPFKVLLPGGNAVFLTVNRSLRKGVDSMTDKEKSFHRGTDNYSLLKVDEAGITQIRLSGIEWKIGRIAALGALGGTSSRGAPAAINELVVWSLDEEEGKLFLSRHRPDGSVMDAPREIYAEVPMDRGLVSAFAPGASRMVVFDPGTSRVYFAMPDKPVNWIRAVDVKKLLGNSGAIRFINALTAGNGEAAAVIARENELFAIDEEGRCRVHTGGVLAPSSECSPYLSFSSQGSPHELVSISPSEDDSALYLAAWSRAPGARKLTTKELSDAAKKFLHEDEFEQAKEVLEIRFGEAEKIEANDLAEKKGLGIEIKSLEDVEEYMPEYLEELKASAGELFDEIIGVRLFRPIERPDYELEDGDYENMTGYKAWLKSVYLEGETIFAAARAGGSEIREGKLNGYFFPKIETKLSLPKIAFKEKGGKKVAVATLKKRTMTERGEPGYYEVEW